MINLDDLPLKIAVFIQRKWSQLYIVFRILICPSAKTEQLANVTPVKGKVPFCRSFCPLIFHQFCHNIRAVILTVCDEHASVVRSKGSSLQVYVSPFSVCLLFLFLWLLLLSSRNSGVAARQDSWRLLRIRAISATVWDSMPPLFFFILFFCLFVFVLPCHLYIVYSCRDDRACMVHSRFTWHALIHSPGKTRNGFLVRKERNCGV